MAGIRRPQITRLTSMLVNHVTHIVADSAERGCRSTNSIYCWEKWHRTHRNQRNLFVALQWGNIQYLFQQSHECVVPRWPCSCGSFGCDLVLWLGHPRSRVPTRALTCDPSLAKRSVASRLRDQAFLRNSRGMPCFDQRALLHGVTDTMKHEPSRPLRYFQLAGDGVRTDVPVVRDEPHGGQPLAQGDGGVLENRSHFHRELLAASQAGPDSPRLEEGDLLTIATRTRRTVR